MMKVENEFIECKQDAIIENAEIVSYKILIEIAKKDINWNSQESKWKWCNSNTWTKSKTGRIYGDMDYDERS